VHVTRRRQRVLGWALALACFLPGQVRAQEPAPFDPAAASRKDLPDLGLEDLLHVKVYAASRSVQDATQVPASVTVIRADEIRRQGYRTLADVLRAVRGFYVSYDRNYSYLGVRGFLRPGDYNTRILLLVNGHRMNDVVFEQALLGTESPIDVRLIDRVEVIRGPSSSLYGTSAFFAVVNLVTRTGHGLNGTEAELEGGSQATVRGRLMSGGRNARGFEGLFAVSSFRSDGNTQLAFPELARPGESTATVIDADLDRGASVYVSGSHGGFTAQAGGGTRIKTVPTAPFDTLVNDPRTQTRDDRAFADLQFTRQLDPRTRVTLRGAYDQYRYAGTFAYASGPFNDDAHALWLTGEGQVVHQTARHTLTVGAEYRRNVRQDQSAAGSSGTLLDVQLESHTAGVFAEDEYRLHRRVLVNGGVRWDEYAGSFGSTVNPRIGVVVTPVGGSTLKALYGTAFRAPNPFELYYDQNAISRGLRPERIRSFELAWEQRMATRLALIGSVFRNHVSDLITQRSGSRDTLDGLYYVNGDSVTARGVELEVQGELPGRIHTRVGQVFQRAGRDGSTLVLSNSPRTLSTLVLDAPVPRTDLVVAFNGYFVGERRRQGQSPVDSAFVGNLSVTRQASRGGLGLGLTIYNVFDAAYADPGSVEHRQSALPGDGRTALVRLWWRFR